MVPGLTPPGNTRPCALFRRVESIGVDDGRRPGAHFRLDVGRPRRPATSAPPEVPPECSYGRGRRVVGSYVNRLEHRLPDRAEGGLSEEVVGGGGGCHVVLLQHLVDGGHDLLDPRWISPEWPAALPCRFGSTPERLG